MDYNGILDILPNCLQGDINGIDVLRYIYVQTCVHAYMCAYVHREKNSHTTLKLYTYVTHVYTTHITHKTKYESYMCSSESLNPFMTTVPTFSVRETDVSRHNGGSRSNICSLSDSKCWNGGTFFSSQF